MQKFSAFELVRRALGQGRNRQRRVRPNRGVTDGAIADVKTGVDPAGRVVDAPGVVDDAPMRVTVSVFPLAWAKFSMSNVSETPVDCPATGVPVTLDVDPSDNACTSDTPDGDDHSPDDPSIA